MPEARDRLSRPEDIAAAFNHRRTLISRGVWIRPNAELATGFGTPFRWRDTPLTGTHGAMGNVGGGVRRGSFGTPRFGGNGGNGRGRNLRRTRAMAIGRENLTPARSAQRGRGRSTNSVLPSWHPRRPLGDITAIVRAIDRRRARLRESEGQQIDSPIPHDQAVLGPSVPVSVAQLEHDTTMLTPNPTTGIRPVSKVPKILLDVTNQNAGEAEFLTPQKKLLDSIDKVEKEVVEELRSLKRTPTAKKAERERKVRTLMSMR